MLSSMYHWFRRLLSGDPIRTTWTSGGVARSVTTYHQTGETAAHWSQRHIADLKAALAAYPPDAVAHAEWTSGGSSYQINTNDTSYVAASLASHPPDV